MKFKTIATYVISIAVILSCMVLATNTENKAHREESAMEYMNSFFANSNGNKETNKINHKRKLNNHKKSQKKLKKNKNYRFKEGNSFDVNTTNVPPTASTSPKPANSTSVESASSSASGSGSGSSPLLSEWFMISSSTFANHERFPPVLLSNGKDLTIRTNSNNFRINDAYKTAPSDKGPSEIFFWFRLSGLHIYYSTSKTDINILGAISVTAINDVINDVGESSETNPTYCFSVKDFDNSDWKICGYQEKTVNLWICSIKKLLGPLDEKCEAILSNANGRGNGNGNGNGNSTDSNLQSNVKIIEKQITQPIIIVPLPSRHCNDGWNYQRNGADWECDCSEGREQSPINLPTIESAIDSPVKPLFQYDEVKAESQTNTREGQLKEKSALKIQLVDNNMRIKHNRFGKIVTMDSAVYYAQEIIIHTPAEHKIDDKKYAMEVQIVHYGQSVGDIGKQIILSFLFEKTPGVYNKFIDDLDFFNLPNPLSKERDIISNIFLPKIFYSADDNDEPVMKPFSFYTYQGSLTQPPCTENTIMYVASKPIPLGSTAIKLFQEALRVPDLINEKGDIIVSDWLPLSNRKLQPRNGRPVFHYNHEKYCGPDPVKTRKDEGHYEKVQKQMTQYFYVNGPQPSGIPNAFVVSQNEAVGKDLKVVK